MLIEFSVIVAPVIIALLMATVTVVVAWVSFSRAFLADLANSFRPQIIILDLAITIILLILALAIPSGGMYLWPFFVSNILLVLILSGTVFAVSYFNQRPTESSGQQIRIGSFNKQIGNKNSHLFASYVNKINLDVVGVSEVKRNDFKQLLKTDYPYSYNSQKKFGLGMAEFLILSKYPIKNISHITLDRFGNAVRFEIRIKHQTLVAYLVHTTAPVAPELYVKRNTGMEKLAQIIRSDNSRNVVMFGDMNITPYSWVYRKFESAIKSHLYNITKGRGIIFTWKFSGPFIAQLDHMWASNHIYTKKFKVDKRLNSDHNLIWADIIL